MQISKVWVEQTIQEYLHQTGFMYTDWRTVKEQLSELAGDLGENLDLELYPDDHIFFPN